MPAVTLHLVDDEVSPSPIEDVVVEFYSTGAVFQTSSTTDEDGEVTVTLPVADYDVLFYKAGLTVLPRQPQRIEVLEGSNDFTVECHLRTLPEATDPKLTRVTGKFTMVHGGHVRERMVFYPRKDLLVYADGVVELNGRYEVASDAEGYFDFQLLRNIEYYVYFIHLDTLLGEAAGKLHVFVPDAPAIDLGKLLFPLPQVLSFSDEAITLVAGGDPDESVDATLSYSDGSIRSGGIQWASIALSNSNSEVVESAIRDGKLCLKPLTAGTAVISSTRSIATYAYWEEVPEYVTDSITVTVI